ncbi:aldo/keto reductase [Streptomyces sp. N2-109]|uniref:Aldo/keto reductase n=2 Tax=Streptomyces gossypii TaxID=2883101 RepID=A0ABT2JZZ7_9ACTN|nr:aldo/keto reductase [Streptomyces gossypii]
MPQLGFGVWQVPDDDAASAVGTALEAGYRSIDTAAVYDNEKGTGQGIAASGIPREELFVTTKLWNSASETWTRDSVFREFDASLARLGLDHIDLYLIHWPRPMRDDYLTIWRAFGELLQSGRTRAVGVSNFKPEHLHRVIEDSGSIPSVNQIELHPRLQQPVPRAFHSDHGIVTEAWSPLGQGGDILAEERIVALAEKHERTPAQIILRWHLQLGNVVIPKSVTPARIRENFDVFGFELADADMASIGALNTDTRLGADPDVADF